MAFIGNLKFGFLSKIILSTVFKINKILKQGFTLIELLVVISIMAIMVSLFTINLKGSGIDRGLTIAQNELVTNLRKAQSYTLSSREAAPGRSGQFFILKFDASTPTKYVLQAMYGISATPTPPTLVDSMESYQLPAGVQLALIPLTIYRPPNIFPASTPVSCGLIAFKGPYAKVYLNGNLDGNCHSTTPHFVSNYDDYENILEFVANTSNYSTTVDSSAVIKLTDSSGTKARYVMVRGASGLICPAQSPDNVNWSCSNQ